MICDFNPTLFHPDLRKAKLHVSKHSLILYATVILPLVGMKTEIIKNK